MATENRKYFLTGCTGFVGREIVRQLVKRNDTERITLLTRDPQRRYEMLSWSPKIGLYEGDITTTDFPQSGDYTDLIHGANEANDLLQPDAHRYYYTIVEGTQRIMQWAWDSRIERVTLLSSGAAARDTVYGRAKRISEGMTRNTGGSIARIYSVIGEEMPLNGQYAAGIFVWQALYEGKVTVRGGESIRAYLHVEDCARAIIDGHTREVPDYDVCGVHPVSIRELASEVALVFDVPLVVVEDECYRKDVYVSKAGTEQTISLTEALKRVKQHYNKETTPCA